jgi:hypothetical protein
MEGTKRNSLIKEMEGTKRNSLIKEMLADIHENAVENLETKHCALKYKINKCKSIKNKAFV